jgi:hypothetical protein
MPLTAPTSPDPATPHAILWESIEESWGDDGPAATVQYRCAWEDRYDLAVDLRGGYRTSASGLFAWNPPHRYPPSPNMYCLRLTSIRPDKAVRRDGGASKWLPYKYAIVTAEYGIPPFDYDVPTAAGQIDASNPILQCKQDIQASTAFIVLGKRKLKFSASGKAVDTEATKLAAQSEFTLEFPRVNFNPYPVIRPYLGKISSTAMFHHDAEEILLDSAQIRIQPGDLSGPDVSVVLTYLGRDESWNKLVNDEGEYEYVEYMNSSPVVRPFELVDHFQLLQ